MNLFNLRLADVIPAFAVPCFFLLSFYSYFYIISNNIYGNFNLNPLETLLYLPAIFKGPFLSFMIICLLLGILKEYKKSFAVIFPIILFIYFVIYTIQYFALYLTNRYLMPESFLHIDQISLIAGYQVCVKTAVILIIFALMGYATWSLVNRFDKISKIAGRYRSHAIQIVLTIYIFFILCIPGLLNTSAVDGTQFFGLPAASPETAFVNAVKKFYFRSPLDDRPEISDDLRTYMWQHYGISYKKNAEYPLIKNWIYQTPIPLTKVGGKTRPNVIIFFLESLSANLVGSYNRGMKTQNIDGFAKEATVIDGYYNHTFPTISGIRGQLCSFYPVLGENEHAEQEGIALKLFCLPHVLNRHHYSTFFFFYSPALYKPLSATLNMRKLIEACGFNKVYVAEDIQKQLTGLESLEGYNFKNSVNDLGMMSSLVKYLQSYKEKDKPFFIALSTMGTHPNIEDSDEKIGGSLRKLDEAFGIFWEYFRKSPYYDNTIVIVTADHACPPTVQYKKFIGLKDRKLSFYDQIALIIFDKRYDFPKRLQVKANSIDLVPTVLQLLDINNEPNAFQGLSIFSDRKEHPYLLCSLMDRFYVHDADGIHEKESADYKDVYKKYSDMNGDILNNQKKRDADLQLWFAYNKYLNDKNKIWNGIFKE